MATIGRWKSPYSGLCLPVDWYDSFWSAACPGPIVISLTGSWHISRKLSTNFAGRGILGGNCSSCAADQYYLTCGATAVSIDVWKAYLDGVWTSSTTILVYASKTSGASGNLTTRDPSSTTVDVTAIGADTTGSCPTTLQVTITVNDDGTFSVA